MRNVHGPQRMNPTLSLHLIGNIIRSQYNTCKAKFKQFVVKLHFKGKCMGKTGTQCMGRKEIISVCCICLLFCYMAHLGGIWTPNNRWWPGGNAFVDLLCAEKNHHIARQDSSANSCLSQLLAHLNKKNKSLSSVIQLSIIFVFFSWFVPASVSPPLQGWVSRVV